MLLFNLGLHALSVYFGVATRNTVCGRKLQNKYSTCLLALTDVGKSLFLLLISSALVSPGNDICKRYANHFARRIRLCLANESLAHNQRTRHGSRPAI